MRKPTFQDILNYIEAKSLTKKAGFTDTQSIYHLPESNVALVYTDFQFDTRSKPCHCILVLHRKMDNTVTINEMLAQFRRYPSGREISQWFDETGLLDAFLGEVRNAQR